jgi:L-cysteine/cystine lyase
MYIGLEWIHRRSAELARAAAERLAATPGVTLLAPQDLLATTIAFRIDGWSAPDALDELGARIFALASVVPGSDAIRIGTGFFNTEDELERFAGGVELLASHPPGTLPPRRQLTIIGGER